MDYYLDWCGPCNVMAPYYRTMYFSYDQPEERIEIWQCPTDLIPKDYLDGDEDLNPPQREAVGEFTCKPKFAVYLEGELKGVIDGVDYTKIADLVNIHIPTLEQE